MATANAADNSKIVARLNKRSKILILYTPIPEYFFIRGLVYVFIYFSTICKESRLCLNKKVCRTGVGQTFLDIVVYFRVDRILYEFYFCMLSISGGDQGERHRPQGRGADAGRDEVHDAQGAVRDHYGVHEQDAPTLHSLRVSPSML